MILIWRLSWSPFRELQLPHSHRELFVPVLSHEQGFLLPGPRESLGKREKSGNADLTLQKQGLTGPCSYKETLSSLSAGSLEVTNTLSCLLWAGSELEAGDPVMALPCSLS